MVPVVLFNGKKNGVETQQKAIWALLPETKLTACKVRVRCEQSGESGLFHSRRNAKGSSWAPQEKLDNLALAARLHRAVHGRSDRPPKAATATVEKKSGTKRKPEATRTLHEMDEDAASPPMDLESKRARRPSPDDSASLTSTSVSSGSDSGMESPDSEDTEDPEDLVSAISDAESEASCSEDEQPVITVVTRKELNQALAKLRSVSWRSPDSKVPEKQRVQAYLVLLRSYVSVLPMSDIAKKEWEYVRQPDSWRHEELLFGGNWQDLLVMWQLPYQRQKDVFEELLRGQVIVRFKQSKYDGHSGPQDVWRWSWSETALAAKVRSAFEESMREDCPMCRTLDPDWHHGDCPHGNFNEQHPDVREMRRKLHPIVIKYLASEDSIVGRALTMARGSLMKPWYDMQNPKLYFYDDFRRAEQLWPEFSWITGKRMTADYLIVTAGDKSLVRRGLDDWVNTTAVDTLIDWGFFSTKSQLEDGTPEFDLVGRLPSRPVLKQLFKRAVEANSRNKCSDKVAKCRSAMLQQHPEAPDYWADFYHDFGRPLRVVDDEE